MARVSVTTSTRGLIARFAQFLSRTLLFACAMGTVRAILEYVNVMRGTSARIAILESVPPIVETVLVLSMVSVFVNHHFLETIAVVIRALATPFAQTTVPVNTRASARAGLDT